MKNLRAYPMAMTAAIIAMILCLGPYCIAGIPFGIWAIVVLQKPHIRSEFS